MNPEASARIDSLLSGGFWAWVTDVARSLRQEKGTIIPPVQGGLPSRSRGDLYVS